MATWTNVNFPIRVLLTHTCAIQIFALKQRNATENLATTVYGTNKKWSKQITDICNTYKSLYHIFSYTGIWRWFKINRRKIAVKIDVYHPYKTAPVEFITTRLISSKLQFTFVTAMTNISSLLRSEIFDYNNNSSVIYFVPDAKHSARLHSNTKVFPNTVHGYLKVELAYFKRNRQTLKCLLYSFLWVIPRWLNFICRRFGKTLFHHHRRCKYEKKCLL